MDLSLDLLDDPIGDAAFERVLEEAGRIVKPSLPGPTLSHRQTIELVDDSLSDVRGHVTQRSKGASDILDGLRGEFAENRPRRVRVEQQEQHGALGHSVKLGDGFWKFLTRSNRHSWKVSGTLKSGFRPHPATQQRCHFGRILLDEFVQLIEHLLATQVVVIDFDAHHRGGCLVGLADDLGELPNGAAVDERS